MTNFFFKQTENIGLVFIILVFILVGCSKRISSSSGNGVDNTQTNEQQTIEQPSPTPVPIITLIPTPTPTTALIPCSISSPCTAKFKWDPNSESDLAGYKFYWGTSSRQYTQIKDVGNYTTTEVTGFTSGIWYFAVTAYNTSGLESSYSNEVVINFDNNNLMSPSSSNHSGLEVTIFNE